MKRTYKILALLFCVLYTGVAFSQIASNKGKEFWVGYGHHQYMASGTNAMDMVLYLSTEEQGATVTVTIDSTGNVFLPNTVWKRTYIIPPFTVISTGTANANTYTSAAGITGPMPKTGATDCRLITDEWPAGTGGAGLFRKKGIHIESNIPITAYAHIYASTTSGATMLLPVEAWGYSYVSLNSRQSYASNCYNWMYVVAAEDNTLIEITPSVLTKAQDKTGMTPGVPIQVTLMKGQIYQVIGANDAADANGNGGGSATGKELSGTKVKSIAPPGGECKPIAVFAGSSRTNNPASCGSGGGDNDNQQLFPQHSWGKRYLTVPFSGSSTASSYGTSTFKIAVKDPTTVVRRNGTILTGLINGNYYQYESSSPDYIEADKPIMIVQFMTGGGCLGAGGLGDPEMVVMSPIEQGIKRVAFYRNNFTAISVNYLTLTVKTAGLASLRINNSSTFTYTAPHPNLAGYSIVVQRWASALPPSPALGQCIVTCDSTFTAITYGMGSVESYAYSAGANINNLSAIPGFHNNPDTSNILVNHPYTYVNTPITMGGYIAYKPTRIVWKFSSLGCTVITPCADVTVDNPVPIDSQYIGSSWYYLYRLPGEYKFLQYGTFNIPVDLTSPTGDFGNCNNKESAFIEIIVKPKPTATFTYTQPGGCGIDSTQFTGISPTVNGYPVIKWKWEFTSNPADTSILQNPKFRFPAAGPYPIKLTITTLYGGIADTTITINVTSGSQPTSSYTANQTTICVGESITYTPTSTAPGINGWWWDFGNSTTNTAATNAAQTVTYTTAGSFTVRHHVIIPGSTCPADTINRTIVVLATPNISSATGTNPDSCNGSNGKIELAGLTAGATFTVTYTKDGSPVTRTLTVAANGVLTIPNLTKGVYATIKVSTGTCTSNTVGPVTLTDPNPPATPVVTVGGGSTSICESNNLNLSATTTTTGNVSYAWTGPNGFTSNTQNPTITSATTAATGTYSVIATLNNCVSAAGTIAITIKPVPAIGTATPTNPTTCASATGSIELCGLTANTAFVVNYVKNGAAQTANLTTNATGCLVIPSLTAGNYTSITVTLNGCTSNLVGPFTLTDPNPPVTPTAGSNSAICAGQTLLLTSTPATGGTTVGYTWSGPNGFASTLQNPSIPNATVAASGIYTVRTTVDGCISAPATTVVVVNAIPATPTATATTPVCVGDNINLTASTTGPAAYSWTGPNGFTSNDQNPTLVATLAAAGTYSVTATLNNCLSAAGTVTVVVNPVPAISSSSKTDPTACATATGSITLNGLTAGATYAVTYTKNGTAQTASIAANAGGSVVITALTAGTYADVKLTLAGCSSLPAGPFVLVDPTPPATPVAGNNGPICAGLTLNLTASAPASGTPTYAWTGPGGFTSSLQNPTIANAAATATGTYSVTVTINGCTSAAGTTNAVVHVIPATPTITGSTPICAGTDLTLNATTSTPGSGSYVWTGPNSFASTLQNPTITGATIVASGTYTVKVTINNCESAAGTANMLVNPVPVIASSSSTNPTTCTGTEGTIILNGLAPSTAYTVNYTNASTAQTVNFTSNAAGVLTVTGLAAGTYTNVTATANGCTSAPAGPFTLTDPAPPAVPTAGSNSEVCSGLTLNLTASTTTTGAITYAWTGPNSFTSTVQNPTITNVPVAGSGVYSVTATLNNCTSAAGTTTVVIKPTPTISSSTGNNPTACATATGSIVLNGLTPSTSYAVAYNFNSAPQTATLTSSAAGSITIPNLAAGVYNNVTVTLNGCTSPTAGPFTLSDPNPPATPTVSNSGPICNGGNLNLTATTTTTGTITYTWSGPNGFTSTQQNPTITGANLLANGVYSVTATLNSCTSSAGTTTVVVNAIPAISSTGKTDPTTCATPTGSVLLNGLLPNTSYQVAYTKNGTAQTATITSDASGTVTITNLTAGNYANIVVTFNNCSSLPAGPVTLADPNAPATPVVTNSGPHCEGVTLNLTANTTTPGAIIWSWTGPNGFVSALQNPSIPNSTLVNSGIYSVTASLNGCVSATASTTATINQTPVTPTVSNNGPVCSGTTLNLTANTTTSGTINYAWTGPNGFVSTLQNPSIVGVPLAASGVYTVLASQGNCTSPAATTTVTVNQTPAISTTSTINPSDCNSATGSITLNGLVANTSYTVDYTKDGVAQTATLTTNATGSLVIPTLTRGNYTAISVTLNNCTSTPVGPFTLSDPLPPAVPVVTNNGPLCEGSTLQLTALSSTPGAVTYAWTGPNGFSSAVANPSINSSTTAATGVYTVVATLNSCTSTATTTVAVNPYPVAAFNMPASVCMPNGTANFTNTSSVSDGSLLSYVWDYGDGNTGASPSHLYATTPGSGSVIVKLTVTSSNGCVKDSSRIFSAFFDKPIADFSVNPDKLCQGTNNTFTDNSSAPNSTITQWSWNFGDATFSSVQSPIKLYNNWGNFNVRLVVANAQGCLSDAVNKPVVVYLQPKVDAGPSFIVPVGTVVRFNPTVNDSSILQFTWTPSADFVNPSTLRPSIAAVKNQTYRLTAVGDGGCTASDTMSVKILLPITVPNAFSPNGDGINDTWGIANLADYPGATVEIYNRQGQVVFESTGYSKAWDGTIKGKPAPIGTYYYIIRPKNGFEQKVGWLMLLR